MSAPPFPSKLDALRRLVSASVPISAVVDVGVREMTLELVRAFPDKHHHLFEPVSAFFPDIEKNYRDVPHTLHSMALSNEEGLVFLVQSSLHRNGVVTHSQIKAKPEPIDGQYIIACEQISVRRFDQLELPVQQDFLLKVDVDGLDLQVMQGFGSKIRDASVVIVESTHASVFQRMELLLKAGFHLFDITDIVYYGNALYQMDLVMVRSNLVTEQVRPNITHFKQQLWAPLRDVTK